MHSHYQILLNRHLKSLLGSKAATEPPSDHWLKQTKLTRSLWLQWIVASKQINYNRKLCSKPIYLQDFQTPWLDISCELSNPAQLHTVSELAALDFILLILTAACISVQNILRGCLNKDIRLLRCFSGQLFNHFTTTFPFFESHW